MKFLEKLPIKGTLLNSLSVLMGALVGLQAGGILTTEIKDLVLIGLGLTTIAFGLKMFLNSRQVIIVFVSIGLGGFLGKLFDITYGIQAFSDLLKGWVGASDNFTQAFLTTSLLYTIGPMTFLGCVQEAIENKFEILAIKSILDGSVSVFFAATLGPGVLATALFVLLFQSLLTLLARPLRAFFEDPYLIAELTATGGVVLMALSLNTVQLKRVPAECFLPSLLIAPLLTMIFSKPEKKGSLGDAL